MVGNTTVFPVKFTQIISLMRPPGGPEPNTCSAILWVFSIQLSKPTKSTQKNTETHYMSNTKSNPDTLIASFLLPWKVTNHSTGKEQPNNHKNPVREYCLCTNASKTPRGLSLFQGKKSKSQKVKKNSTFRLFEFFDFSIFRLFEFFEFFDFSSRNLLACELFDFSTFRGQKSWFSRCDRYQPEEHTGWFRVSLFQETSI